MKTLNEILERVINSDTALCAFEPEDLPQAAKARVHMTMWILERRFSTEELEAINSWTLGSRFTDAVASFSEGECTYYYFKDGSLYYSSSGDSEVWDNAKEFAWERILMRYDEGPLDEMDYNLLVHLGGRLEEEAEKRGKC